MDIGRRGAILAGAALFVPRPLSALPRGDSSERIDTVDITSPDFNMLDLFVDEDSSLASRFALLVPKGLPRGTRVPLLIALHGLGESNDEALGVRAWPDLYGLRTSYSRLRHPPVVRESGRKDFTDDRLREVNEELARRPFRGVAVACPFTPHIDALRDPHRSYDAYAAWIADVVVPRARELAPVIATPAATSIVGCSMGGPIALEVFRRYPERFGSVGLVQGAVGAWGAEKYAQMIADAAAAHGPRDVLLLSSSADPFRDGHEALDRALSAKNVPHELIIPPGPHDQPFLREVGAIELLLYEDTRTP